MISNRIKEGYWLLTALCVALWLGSKQPEFRQYADQMGHIATLGVWGGTAVVGIALLIVSYIERSRAGQRLNKLFSRVQSGETVEIRGGSGLVRLMVMLAFAAMVLTALIAAKSWDFYELRLVLLITGIAIVAALEALTVIPLLRQPILRVSRETLESPLFGKLSWRDIDGFELSELQLRGFIFHHRLQLLIPRLPFLSGQLHPATRWVHGIRSIFRPNDKLHLRLLRASESPKVILTLCQRTCFVYTSNTALSDSSGH